MAVMAQMSILLPLAIKSRTHVYPCHDRGTADDQSNYVNQITVIRQVYRHMTFGTSKKEKTQGVAIVIQLYNFYYYFNI